MSNVKIVLDSFTKGLVDSDIDRRYLSYKMQVAYDIFSDWDIIRDHNIKYNPFLEARKDQ